MPRLNRLGINILHIMRVENSGFRAVQDGLLARRIREAEAAPTIYMMSTFDKSEGVRVPTYLGVLLGAQTIATLSGIIT
jgi:hypothetical protein